VEELSEQLQQPVVSVHQNTPIDVAARTLAEHDSDCLVLVDDRGVAVGALRALDLLRAVLGLRVSRSTGDGARHTTSWSRGALLDLDNVRHAPPAPGILLLDPSPLGGKPHIAWVEATTNLRERLDEMLRLPQDEPVLERLLSVHPRMVTFRVLAVSDAERRARLLQALKAVLARRVEEDRGERTSEE
jgi:CBS domain-containing protein